MFPWRAAGILAGSLIVHDCKADRGLLMVHAKPCVRFLDLNVAEPTSLLRSGGSTAILGQPLG